MTDEKMTITSAVDAYISHLMLSRKPRTAEQAMFVLHPFKRIFGDRLLSGFTRHDHDGYILNLPQGARTKTNHSVRICALLRHFDFPEGELKRMAKARPKFIKKPPVSYTQAEIEKFMAAARDHSFEANSYSLPAMAPSVKLGYVQRSGLQSAPVSIPRKSACTSGAKPT